MVEFYQGEMIVFRNESPRQTATDFLLASAKGQTQGQCLRYDLIEQHLKEWDGKASFEDALRLLEDVSQDSTQRSIIYHMTSGDLEFVMGRDYSGKRHLFHLGQITR